MRRRMLWQIWPWIWDERGGGRLGWPPCGVERQRRKVPFGLGSMEAGGLRGRLRRPCWYGGRVGGTAPFLLAAEVEVWESEQGDGQLPTVPWLEAHAVLLAARLLQLVPGSQAEGYELAEMDYGREEEEEWVVEVLSWLSRPVAAGAGGRRRGAAASAAG